RKNEPAVGVSALLDLLAKLVPEAAGGPPPPKGTPVQRAAAWSTWWEASKERYSEGAVSKAVASYMDATADVTTARLDDLVKLGGAASAAVLSQLTRSTGERRQRAALALSLVAHKPWDLTVRKSDYEREWVKLRK